VREIVEPPHMRQPSIADGGLIETQPFQSVETPNLCESSIGCG